MKRLFLILLIAGVGISLYDVSAECISPHCYAVAIDEQSGVHYQGLRYDIEIPDLYIDETACEEMGAVVTGWVNITPTFLGEPQWVENGVTVGWIDNDVDPALCVTTESAYFAYSIDIGTGEAVYKEDLSDPHGDVIGIEKKFEIEQNGNGEYIIRYGDSQGLDDYGIPLDFGLNRGFRADFGAEGTIDQDYTLLETSTALNTQYSTIPSTRITDAEYKTGNSWIILPSNANSITNPVEGYDVDLSGTPGTFGAGASTVIDSGFLAVVNTPPTITSVSSYDFHGSQLVIELSGIDADKDYIKFELLSAPTEGQLDHVNTGIFIDRNTPTSAVVRWNALPSTEAGTVDSFTYSITDGRDGHSTSGTININILSLSDDNYAFFEDFENGLGNWIAVDDDDGDTHEYDFWESGISAETPGVDGDYAYIRDCDTGCTLTMYDDVDITLLSNPWLRFDSYIDNIRFSDGDYYDIDYFDGSNWINLRHWDRDAGQGWRTENIDLASYANPNFKIRLSTVATGSSDYAALDTVIIYDLGPPSDVTDLDAIGTPSSVTLSWSIPFDNGSTILDYQIQRQTESGSFVTIESNYGDATTNSYTDNTVTDDTQYTYKIKAQNAEGSSTNYSNLATIITPLGDRAPVIETISDVSVVSETTIQLPVYVSDLNGDVISFGVSGAGFVSISKISDIEATLTINPTASDAGTHSITVTATDPTSLFDTENFDVIVTVANTAPILDGIGNHTTDELVELSFTANATDADGDLLSFGLTSNPSGSIINATSGLFTWTPSTSQDGLYTFDVTVTDGIDTDSETIQVTVNDITIPDIPTSLNATVGDTLVDLTWSAPTDDGGSSITDYIISYKLNESSSFTIFSDGTTNSTTATVTGLTNDSLYNFVVNATNSIGIGPASNVTSATPVSSITIPDAPTRLTATAVSEDTIDISWSAPENDGSDIITGYYLERNLNELGFEFLVNDTGSVSVRYSDGTLSANSTAQYRVSAINGIGTSIPSNVAGDTTPFPTLFQFTGIIRDFHDTHPNMQEGCSPGCQIHSGIVGPLGSSLDSDGKPQFYTKDNDNTLTNAADFSQWYRTINGTNIEQPITIELSPLETDDSIYSFDSGSGFFPIDDDMFGNEGRSHNYHFTIEFHSTFAFDDPTESSNQSFTFKGDDDVWVYVNGTLILDIGGVHPAKTKSFTASQLMAEPFNLLPNTIYDLDLFFAERQTVQSNFRIDTTINFDPSFTLVTSGNNSTGPFEQRTIDIASFRNADRSGDDVTIYETNSTMSVENSVMKIDFPADLLIIKNVSSDDGDNTNDNLIEITESTRTPDANVVSGTIQSVLEIGDPLHRLDFDKAVKITLFGQEGNSAFYIDSDNVTNLIPQCSEPLADSAAATIYLNNNDLGECYSDSSPDLVIWTMHFTGFGSVSTDSSSKKSDGDDNEWMKKPTFGASHKTDSSLVQCGFSWDGICYDITDNWHTPFEKVNVATNTLHNMTMKAHFEYPPLFMEFALVPELEAYHKSETKIEIIFENDFNNYYQPDDDATDVIIKSIAVIQNENLIDESLLSGTISKVSCGYVDSDCYELSINGIMFRDVPYFEKIGIVAADTERRYQITYLNEGFEIDGISLNSAYTDTITHPTKLGSFNVIQLDRFENLWADEDGIIYTHNDVYTWERVTPIPFERFQDPETTVMTRMHSEFGGLIEQQRLIAEKTFAENFGDYTNDEPSTFTPTDYTKNPDTLVRGSDSFEQWVTLQEEIAQVYLDSLSSTD